MTGKMWSGCNEKKKLENNNEITEISFSNLFNVIVDLEANLIIEKC